MAVEYINNKQLYAAVCEWKRKCKEAGCVVKQPDFIGLAIMKIAHGLSSYYKFVGYTQSWKEEMIADGVEASVKGLINFNEEKFDNPHAYITMMCYNAFIQRIKKEKREQAKKYNIFLNDMINMSDAEIEALGEEVIQDIYEKSMDIKKRKKPTKQSTECNTPLTSTLSFFD